jgi:arylsulfatase A-like enzyme
MKRLFILGLTAAVLCLAASCSRARAPNIILIVVDTLRPDRLGAYGNPRHLSPFVDSLAARAYVFRHAYAQSSWTNPSVASLLTSRFQSQHGIVGFESVLADSELTLAEVLKQRGYTTGFFSANGMIAKHMGFGQGYDEWSSILVQPTDQPRYMWIPERAARINRDALAWLDSLSSPSAPIFLHLHYMEPHNPYAPRPEALAHIADGGPPPDAERANSSVLFGHALPVKPEVLRNVQDVYDAEVLSLDIELRSLFEELERRHVLDHSIVRLHRRPRRGVKGARVHRAR